MFKCEISKAIWKDEQRTSLHAVLIRQVELPFPPSCCLDIKDGKFNSGEITGVTWDIDKQMFFVGTKYEIPWKDKDGHVHTAEEITAHLVKRVGWIVST
ncbi:hypothetical protein [Nitrosomonas aestuarii]|nr:hypothetical protein [Nitrosomonas aestuarii]